MQFTLSALAKAREARRMRAVAHFSKGKSQAWVARHFHVTTATTNEWCKRWKQKGVQGMKSLGPSGAKKKLTKEKLKTVERILLRGATYAGFSSGLWTLDRVACVIKKEAHAQYHPGHVWKILTNDLGWSNQKPVRRARERNESAITQWKKEVWPTLKKGGARPPPLDSLMNRDSRIVP